MSFTTINSAGSLFEGSDSAEKVAIESGSLTRTTIEASGGEDTIQIELSGGAGGTAAYIDLNAGADFALLNDSGGIIAETTILGGAGADTIQMTSMDGFEDGQVKAGDGSDQVLLDGSVFSGTDLILGAGADTLIFTGVDGEVGNLTGSSILGGAGTDDIIINGDASMSATTIFGGGGADYINISGALLDGGVLNGDSTVNGGGADTIIFSGVAGDASVGDSATVRGKGGADVISITGTIGDSARIEGNAGADNITIKGLVSTSTFVGGGSGNDTITISGTTINQQNSTIQAGGGVDFITFNGLGQDYKGTGLRIYGGAGADTIELGNTFTGEVRGANATGVIAFTDLSDSDLAGIDKVTGGAGAVTISGFEFALDTAAGITSFTIGSYSDSDASTPSVTAGLASGATFASADSGVTARVEELDGILSTKGTLVAFQAQGEDYIFIQGGESGTADDGVIEVQSGIASFNVDTDYQFGAIV